MNPLSLRAGERPRFRPTRSAAKENRGLATGRSQRAISAPSPTNPSHSPASPRAASPSPGSSLRSPQPVLRSRLNVQDTCGVHNVHGMPGILGTLLGTLLTALATADAYGNRMELIFPHVADGSRTASYQAVWQLCALPVTLLLVLLGGSIAGAILKIKRLGSPADTQHLENKTFREVSGERSERWVSRDKLGTSTSV